MYPRNAASPPEIAIGAVVQISDGAVQASGVSISVKAKGGTAGAGGGTTAYGTGGSVYYTPTQAETNYEEVIVEAYKTGCIPVAQTIVTTASSTAGKVDVSHIGGATQTGRDLGASVLVGDKTGFSLATAPPTAAAIATAVWAETTRTLSSFGTLVADIWASATRTLTAAADSSGITTLLARIVGTLAAGTHQPQSGDAFAVVNNVTHGNAALQADTAALVARLTALRAGYLDNLSVGAVAQASTLAMVAGYLDTEIAAILAVAQKLDTALELNGGLYRLTVAALANAPTGGGSGLTAQQTRDALLLAPSAGAAAAGSIDALVAVDPLASPLGAEIYAAGTAGEKLYASYSGLGHNDLKALGIYTSGLVTVGQWPVQVPSVTFTGAFVDPAAGVFSLRADHRAHPDEVTSWGSSVELGTWSPVGGWVAGAVWTAENEAINGTIGGGQWFLCVGFPDIATGGVLTITGVDEAGNSHVFVTRFVAGELAHRFYIRADGSRASTWGGVMQTLLRATESAPGAIEAAALAGGGASSGIVQVNVSTRQG